MFRPKVIEKEREKSDIDLSEISRENEEFILVSEERMGVSV